MKASTLILMMPNWGCYTTVSEFEGEKCLLAAAMMEDGSMDMHQGEPNWVDVSEPVSQEFLDEVNRHFGTDFRMEQF